MWANFHRNMVFYAPVGMVDTPGVMSSRFAGPGTRGTGALNTGIRAIGVSVIGVRQLAVRAPPGVALRNPVLI